MKIFRHLLRKPLDLLLVGLILAVAGEVFEFPGTAIFVFAALGVIPLADYIGEATEALAVQVGPRWGGVLNATLGNAAELIITFFAIREGLIDLVLASITGSVIGNLFFVMGLSMFLGGLKNGFQRFDQRNARNSAVMLILSVAAILVPSLVSQFIGPDNSPKVEIFSLGVAGIMIVLYVLSLVFGFKHLGLPHGQMTGGEDVVHEKAWPMKKAVVVLCLATLGVVYLSEVLVGSVSAAVSGFGISEYFIGLIVVPIIGNIAEHLVAVTVAIKNRMQLSVEIATSSSLQIAMFVAPVLVFVSLAMGHPMHLVFNLFELISLMIVAIITWVVSSDGESSWLEGAALLSMYAILGLAFFLLP